MRFCKLHMPKNDSMFLLENEKQEEYKVNYIAQRTALSGGWKAFSDANGLLENDVIVFHLIAPLKFKVPFKLVSFLITNHKKRSNVRSVLTKHLRYGILMRDKDNNTSCKLETITKSVYLYAF